jgi:hypothetical protein
MLKEGLVSLLTRLSFHRTLPLMCDLITKYGSRIFPVPAIVVCVPDYPRRNLASFFKIVAKTNLIMDEVNNLLQWIY